MPVTIDGGVEKMPQMQPIKHGIPPDEALQLLKVGNSSYADIDSGDATYIYKNIREVQHEQHPFATILSCSDSRVPVELIMGGRGPGEIFVIRNAGNIADVNVIGSIEYSVIVLGVTLVVIMGHWKCGAAAAACDLVQYNNKKMPSKHIGDMIQPIVRLAKSYPSKQGDFVNNVIKAHAKKTVETILEASPIMSNCVKTRTVKIQPAYYDLPTRRVEFL